MAPLEEFADLARSAGATVVAHLLTARIDRPNPATLIGSGKLEEVKAAARGDRRRPGAGQPSADAGARNATWKRRWSAAWSTAPA